MNITINNKVFELPNNQISYEKVLILLGKPIKYTYIITYSKLFNKRLVTGQLKPKDILILESVFHIDITVRDLK